MDDKQIVTDKILRNRIVLIDGPWGVGKTTFINDLFKQEKHVLKISLFGIKDINSLKTMLIESSRKFWSKIKKITKIIEPLELGCKYGNINFSIDTLVDEIFLSKFKDKNEFIIIFDDIERKDNNLTLNEIFSLIEHLKTSNTKFILIMNKDEINRKEIDTIANYIDKVVDENIKITEPFINVKSIVVKDKEIFQNCMHSIQLINNLRTIQKAVKTINYYEIKDKVVMNIIFLLFLNKDCPKFMIRKLIQHNIEEWKESIRVGLIDVKKDDEYSNVQNIESKVYSKFYTNKMVFIEFVKRLETFSICDLHSLIKESSFIYDSFENNDLSLIKNCRIKVSINPLEEIKIDLLKIFLSNNPNKFAIKYMKKIYTAARSNTYDSSKLFQQYYMLYIYSIHTVKVKFSSAENKIINKTKKIVFYKLTNDLIKYDYVYEDIFDNTYYTHNNEYKILYKEIVVDFITYFKNQFKLLFKKQNKFNLDKSIKLLNKCKYLKNVQIDTTNEKCYIEYAKFVIKNLIDKLIRENSANTWNKILQCFDLIFENGNDELSSFLSNYNCKANKYANNRFDYIKINYASKKNS